MGWAAIRPIWVTALITTGASLALQNAQALDALDEIAGGPLGARLTLIASVLLLSFAAWYFPRALLYVAYPTTPPSPERHEPLRRWAPRVLGVLPLLSVALAYGKLAAIGQVVHYLVLAAAFVFFLIRRRRGRPVPPLSVEMPTITFRVSVSLQVLSLLCLVAFLLSKVTLPQFLGPLGIVMLAAAMWISFTSIVLIYPTYRYSFPSGILLLLVLAGVFSYFNDNHQVRQLPGKPVEWRQPFNEHFSGWRALRNAGEEYPIFVVAAEGGGIRAAYWTAAVLSQIEDMNPGFACHLFAISGVSGGSLGGAVFAALVADLLRDGELRCDGSSSPRQTLLTPRAHEVLKQDFLAPTLAGLLFPDVAQRFLPFSQETAGGRLALPDRARYLEESWETAQRRFGQPFQALWQRTDPAQPDPRYQVPALFLNGTWVENGGRVVTTNVDTQDSSAFVRLDDMLGCLGRNIRLSTAAHMSARFTYISPAGTVRVADPQRCQAAEGGPGAALHVVDGGYFENSGAHTASEILEELSWPRSISLIVSNNPDNPNSADARRPSEETAPGVRPFGEILSPILALLNTRSARGYYAESYLAGRSALSLRLQLRNEDTAGRRRGLEPEKASFPLGWTLSPDTELRMVRQASINPKIVEVCRLMPVSPDFPDRCEEVAETIADRCGKSYGPGSARCAELRRELRATRHASPAP
jgi:hypothetical protein